MISNRMRSLAVRAVVLVAIWLDALLYGLVVPFLPERAIAQGATAVQVGALFATYALGVVVATYPAGMLTDRFGPRRALLAGLLMLLAATLLFGFAEDISAHLPFLRVLWLLFAARGAQGMAAAATWTAGLAILARQSARASHTALFAQAGTAMGIGTLLGPPLGGLLYSAGGFRAPFLFAAGLACLDGLGRMIVLPADSSAREGHALDGDSPARALFRRRAFLLALLAIAAGDLILTALEPTLPPLFTYSFGLTPLLIGLLFGGLVAGYTVAQSIAASLAQHVPRTLILAAGLVVSAVALLGFARALTLGETIFSLAALAIGTSFVLIAGLDLLTASGEEGYSPSDVPYGAIYAAYNFFTALGGLAGPLAAGTFTALLGFRYTFMMLGVPMLVLANLTVLLALITDRRH